VYHKLQIQNSCNTIYPRNTVCFRYIIVNILYEGGGDDDVDDEDDDDDNNNNNNNNDNNKYVGLKICRI
jgi:hypothetical protein